MSAPEIAVVIATRRREARLAFALEALAAQTLSPKRFEVIVVRDADARPPLAPIPQGLRVNYLTAPGVFGPVVKRNRGWRATEAPLIAFTDDDCRPAPQWLESLQAAYGGTRAVLQGRTEPDPEERHLHYGLARTVSVVGPSDWYETCNIAYPSALLQELGGFDERFEWVGDDTDLGLRARAAGAEAVYVENALVWHAVLPRSLPAALREARRFESAALIVRRHPSQRRALFGRLFLRRTHASLTLALLGLLAARRRPLLALVMAIPHLDPYFGLLRLRPRMIARALLHLPIRTLAESAELAAVVRGALRYRTPLI